MTGCSAYGDLVNAPTVWEEGRWSGDRVTRLAALLCALAIALDLVATRHLGWIFGICFVAICCWAALAVRPRDFFRVGVLPPLLLLACAVALSLLARGTVARSTDGFVQGTITALANNSSALLVGYVLSLAVLGMRHRVIGRRTGAHSKRDGSPAPYLVISGAPEEKSTTVVGEEPASPESTTASSQ